MDFLRRAFGPARHAIQDGDDPLSGSPLLGDEERRARRAFNERLTLSPLQKFRQHGKFPYKLTLHLLIVINVTALIICRNQQYSEFTSSMRSSIESVLLDTTDGPEGLFSRAAFEGRVNQSVTNYFAFTAMAPSAIRTSPELTMALSFRHEPDRGSRITPENPLGVLASLSENAFHDLETLIINFYFWTEQKATGSVSGPFLDISYRWRSEAKYRKAIGSGTIEYNTRLYSEILHWNHHTLLIINGLLIPFCIISFLLTVKSFIKAVFVYRSARKRLSQPPQNESEMVWSDLSFSDKLTFFNLWNISSMAGDVCLCISSALAFPRQFGHWETDHGGLDAEVLFRSSGTFLIYISLLKYYEWRADMYMLILAMKASFVFVGKFILTVMPIYMAYALVGMIAFSDRPELVGRTGAFSRNWTSLGSLPMCSSARLTAQQPHCLPCSMATRFCWSLSVSKRTAIMRIEYLRKSIFTHFAASSSQPSSMFSFSSLRGATTVPKTPSSAMVRLSL
eukprot:m.147157 g.147157  ORF g.147157 m.147157 type:complete len:509 (-) comp10102_c3_seq1:527-2053(-)